MLRLERPLRIIESVFKPAANCAVILILVMSTIELPALAKSMSTFPIGSTAEDIQMEASDGEKLSLKKYLGLKRIVVLLVPSDYVEQARQYLTHLSKSETELQDRDLIVLVIAEENSILAKQPFCANIRVVTDADHSLLPASSNGENYPLFVLIGKDSTIRMRELKFVAEKTLFATIDSMPMRAAERRMKRSK